MVAHWNIFYALSVVSLAALASPRPIMVTFGTNPGPIVPRQPKIDKAQDRSHHVVPRDPAPVVEEPDDVPNPYVYRPPTPHQYRKKVLAFRPSFHLRKYQGYSDGGYLRNPGPEYTGPQVFGRQYRLEEEEVEQSKPVRYTRPVLVQQAQKRYQEDDGTKTKYVPQIGIVYSSGVKYYVPYYYRNLDKSNAIDENSVYDSQDEKY